MPENERGALSFADLDVFQRLWISLVRRSQRTPEEVAAADGQDNDEDENGAERMQKLAAPAPCTRGSGYDGLR